MTREIPGGVFRWRAVLTSAEDPGTGGAARGMADSTRVTGGMAGPGSGTAFARVACDRGPSPRHRAYFAVTFCRMSPVRVWNIILKPGDRPTGWRDDILLELAQPADDDNEFDK